jgi:superfamily II DNA or RNA helicase
VGSLTDLLNQLDPREDVRGRQFERLCAWYLRNAPEYRSKIRRVWLWADWPGAWAADAGIDLVAENSDGELWAIQAKAYHRDYAIKKADVDSFLSESSRPEFSYRLLIATTDGIGARARRTIDGQSVPVGYLPRSQLELAQVEWPSSPAVLRPRRPRPKKPFPHVRHAIKETVKGFDGAKRGQLIMACGTGKTLVGLWSSERLESVRTLVLVPSLSLLAQTLREWTANAKQPFDYLAVCSDETVVGEDEFVASTAELGVPVTTDPSEISTFLRRRGRRVVFSTYQSSPQIAAAQRRRTPQFDLAIADEAHRCAGRVASEFATILDADKIKSRRRLFMTATPRYYTPRVRHEAGQLDVDVASMDDEAAFGPVLHRLTFGEAIERDLLSDYQVVVVGVDDDTYAGYAERGEFVTRDGTKITDARTLAGQIGLAKTMRKYQLRRTISFHGRIKAAKEFSDDLPSLVAWMPKAQRPKGKLWSAHVSGQMTSGQRDRLLLRFRTLEKGERNLLSNARCLGEGVDVPSIDGVAFIDPRHSTIDIIQAVGRAIRKAPDKKVGTIMLPVFIPKRENVEQALGDSSFSHVWDVLKALRAHDDDLAERLDELRRRLGAGRQAVRAPSKIRLDLPRAMGVDFARAFEVRLVEQTTASWEFWYGLLQRFAGHAGHADVPAKYTEGGFKLGSWVAHQRLFFRHGTLLSDRAEALLRIPGWRWEPHEEDWDLGYEALCRYSARTGHARPRYLHTEAGYPLGVWVAHQRTLYRKQQLEASRSERLANLPGWAWDPRDTEWEQAFESLEAAVAETGTANLPRAHPMGKWVSSQRGAHKRGRLSADRIDRLAALPGWVWHARDENWEKAFRLLEAYVRREGHAGIRQAEREEGFALGTWVNTQRQYHKRGTLSQDRKKRLERLKGWTWIPVDERWEHGYQRYLRFVEREGHALIPAKYRDPEGFALGSWVSVQRAMFKKGGVDPVRRGRLESLQGWTWDALESGWQSGYRLLRSFVDRTGHAQVPQPHLEGGFLLGAWVNTQRQLFKKGKLSPDRRKRLDALPEWTWKARPSRVSKGAPS